MNKTVTINISGRPFFIDEDAYTRLNAYQKKVEQSFQNQDGGDEIIKDIEDFEGDSAYGRRTMPIVLGVLNSKIIVITFILTTLFSLLYLNLRFLNDVITLIYFIGVLIVPLLFLVYNIFVAENKKEYRRASNLAKLIMLAGILYALVANFIIIQNY